VTSAAATIKSSMRSLETVYKGRELNFKENAILRESYLKTIEETQNFGTQTSDFLKGLPAMVVGGAGGVTLGEYLHLSPIQLWAVGLGLAAVGFGIKTIFVKKARTQTQHLYVAQDYERDCYYEQYVERVKDILMGLLLDLEHIHKKVFGEYYTSDDVDKATAEVECILLGVNPTFCKFVHKHMKENKITPDQWTQCECGIREITGICKHWEGPPITSQ
ncbi:MAG TPA: hypothetical protein VFH88_01640, partial [Candidatus Krumholzibacteria bacterium]|nr:hypothetical protein [Candidatus Krumholzibacteria bacterium]